MGDVSLAIFAEIGAVGVDHRRGVVVEAVLFLLEHRKHQHHAGLFGQLDHGLGRGPVGDRFGVVEMLVLLHLAEVGAVEDLLKADDLGTLIGGLMGVVDVLFDHGVFVSGPLGLDQSRLHNVGQCRLLFSVRCT